MMELTAKKPRNASNAWGRDTTVDVQTFKIEAADVGKVKQHYLGHHYRDHTFKASDVGRTIEVMTTPAGYYCWSFLL